MKSFFVRTMLLLGLVFSYSAGFAQTASAAKKSKEECSAVKSCCADKDTKEAAVATSFAAKKEAIADCPLKGTPDCPLVQDCPLKGTPDCPLVKKESAAIHAVKKTTAKRKSDADLPACCRKSL